MKSVIVTGGTTRIGKAIADHLRECGWRVITTSHRPDAGADIVADFTQGDAADHAFAAAVSLLDGNPPDALVNNAALFAGEESDVMAVNFHAPCRLMKLMAGRTSGCGVVVNILDAKNRRGTYGEAKDALRSYTLQAAADYASRLVVNAVSPGPVLVSPSVHEPAGTCPLGRPTPTQVAAAVEYLLSGGVTGQEIVVDGGQQLTQTRQLALEIRGSSHAPRMEFSLRNFPKGIAIDFAALEQLMARRAPGRDALSTPRRETDEIHFTSGFDGAVTNGELIEGYILNEDVRSEDYSRTVPRPGHADYPLWVRDGEIPPGGGANSGRMTAALCAAGGLCLQCLEARGISITATVVEIGGRDHDFESTIAAAKANGDSVGGLVRCQVTGLKPGIGGPLFDGLECALSAALFAIPGVKGVEFGNGFAAARLRGSENNDAYIVEDGEVRTRTNRHGGILGGMTTGMPLEFTIAFKPTPTIAIEQDSVDLATMKQVRFAGRGRHDPCIVLRALPVVESVTAFALQKVLQF